MRKSSEMKELIQNDINNFDSNGYLILKDFFPDYDLFSFQEALREIIKIEIKRCSTNKGSIYSAAPGREFDLGMTYLEDNDHKHISNINDILYRMPEMFRLISNPEIGKFVSILLHGDLTDRRTPLYCHNAAAILAYPNDKLYTHSWHKDTFYTLPESNYLQIWAPLIQNSTIELGTLKVCPGSHKNLHNGQIYNKDERYIHRYKVTDEELSKYEKLDVCLNLGDLLIFHHGLIHSGGINNSNSTRFSLVATYHEIAFPKFSPNPTKTAFEYFSEIFSTNH